MGRSCKLLSAGNRTRCLRNIWEAQAQARSFLLARQFGVSAELNSRLNLFYIWDSLESPEEHPPPLPSPVHHHAPPLLLLLQRAAVPQRQQQAVSASCSSGGHGAHPRQKPADEGGETQNRFSKIFHSQTSSGVGGVGGVCVNTDGLVYKFWRPAELCIGKLLSLVFALLPIHEARFEQKRGSNLTRNMLFFCLSYTIPFKCVCRVKTRILRFFFHVQSEGHSHGLLSNYKCRSVCVWGGCNMWLQILHQQGKKMLLPVMDCCSFTSILICHNMFGVYHR